MSEFRQYETYEQEQTSGLRRYLTNVFVHMGIGLLVTAGIAFLSYMSYTNKGMLARLAMSFPYFYLVIAIAELGVAIALGAGLTKFSTTTVRILYVAYCALTGVTFSVLPAAYGASNTFTAFLFAAVLFACMAVIGKYTSVDLNKFRGIAIAGLIALVIVSILGIFISAIRDSMVIGYIGIAIFLFYTAWDMQKIESMYYSSAGTDVEGSFAIYGAFQLYLDFINIFLYVLRILGNRRRD